MHEMFTIILAQSGSDASNWLLPFTTRWQYATWTSVLVGIACGVLGCYVVLRRMALIGEALAHAILPGVVIGFLLTYLYGREAMVGALLIGALIAGLTTAILINTVTRLSRTKEDSAIGIVFTALFAIGIILVSALPRGTHFHLDYFLFGDPLAVSREQFLMMAVVAPLVVLTVAALYQPMKLVSFDPVVAAAMGVPVAAFHYLLMGMLSGTIVAGINATGVLLVVAMIITPASAAYQLTNRLWVMMLLSALFGGFSAGAGMVMAFIFNWPSGPAMVLVAAALFVFAVILAPQRGLVVDWLRRRRRALHVAIEDVLKALYRLELQGTQHNGPALAETSGVSPRLLKRIIRRLHRNGLIEPNGHAPPSLTAAGRERAREIVRAHRLWETYLADQTGITDPALHETAEQLEHAHDLADAVDNTLGHPARDPHGEAIPRGGE